jgi:hypothetical protein
VLGTQNETLGKLTETLGTLLEEKNSLMTFEHIWSRLEYCAKLVVAIATRATIVRTNFFILL